MAATYASTMWSAMTRSPSSLIAWMTIRKRYWSAWWIGPCHPRSPPQSVACRGECSSAPIRTRHREDQARHQSAAHTLQVRISRMRCPRASCRARRTRASRSATPCCGFPATASLKAAMRAVCTSGEAAAACMRGQAAHPIRSRARAACRALSAGATRPRLHGNLKVGAKPSTWGLQRPRWSAGVAIDRPRTACALVSMSMIRNVATRLMDRVGSTAIARRTVAETTKPPRLPTFLNRDRPAPGLFNWRHQKWARCQWTVRSDVSVDKCVVDRFAPVKRAPSIGAAAWFTRGRTGNPRRR
jgi:hypothetical protein